MIIILVDSQNLGGIETHILQLAKGLNQANKEIEIWFYKKYNKDHPLEEQLKKNNINFLYLDGSFFTLLAKLGESQVSLIHSHGYKANLLARLVKLIYKIPVVSTFHNGDLGTGMLRLYTKLDLLTSRWSLNIAVNAEIAKRLNNKCHIVNNFISTDDLTISSGKQVAFVGRLSHEKGPDIFIDLASRHKNIKFIIYGTGPMLAELQQQIPNNLSLVGEVSSMENNWGNIGLLSITSRQEGLPMVALEAMAHGIPVLSFVVGGMPQLIKHNYNGWLVDNFDINSMSNYLLEWLDQAKQTKKIMQTQCRETINNSYSTTAIIPQILKLYSSLNSKEGIANSAS